MWAAVWLGGAGLGSCLRTQAWWPVVRGQWLCVWGGVCVCVLGSWAEQAVGIFWKQWGKRSAVSLEKQGDPASKRISLSPWPLKGAWKPISQEWWIPPHWRWSYNQADRQTAPSTLSCAWSSGPCPSPPSSSWSPTGLLAEMLLLAAAPHLYMGFTASVPCWHALFWLGQLGEQLLAEFH